MASSTAAAFSACPKLEVVLLAECALSTAQSVQALFRSCILEYCSYSRTVAVPTVWSVLPVYTCFACAGTCNRTILSCGPRTCRHAHTHKNTHTLLYIVVAAPEHVNAPVHAPSFFTPLHCPAPGLGAQATSHLGASQLLPLETNCAPAQMSTSCCRCACLTLHTLISGLAMRRLAVACTACRRRCPEHRLGCKQL